MQEKDKLRRMVETKIKRLNEEIRQQKDREDRALSQINRCLKQKTEDFEKLHQDHKQVDVEHKKLGSKCDRKQEKMKEIWMELAKITEEELAKIRMNVLRWSLRQRHLQKRQKKKWR